MRAPLEYDYDALVRKLVATDISVAEGEAVRTAVGGKRFSFFRSENQQASPKVDGRSAETYPNGHERLKSIFALAVTRVMRAPPSRWENRRADCAMSLRRPRKQSPRVRYRMRVGTGCTCCRNRLSEPSHWPKGRIAEFRTSSGSKSSAPAAWLFPESLADGGFENLPDSLLVLELYFVLLRVNIYTSIVAGSTSKFMKYEGCGSTAIRCS